MEKSLYEKGDIEWKDISMESKYSLSQQGLAPDEIGDEKGIAVAKTVSELMDIFYGEEGTEDDLAYGRGKGVTKKVAGFFGVEGTEREVVYEDLRDAFSGTLKSVLGESGILTDRDIKRIKKAIPGITSKPEEADMKWNSFFSNAWRSRF